MNEGDAKQLAQENAIMAEIGRIIGSTLDMDQVYQRFAKEARKLIPSDRIAVTLINPDARTLTTIPIHDAALQEIDKNKGIIYDSTVANTCLKLFNEKGYKLID